MHPKVLSRGAWRVVQRLVRAGHLDGWTLAGGTGLALQLGHRYSEDFVYLETGGTLESVLTLVQRRFPAVDYNEYHLLKSLVYFTDAEEEPMPRMIRDLSWNTVKAAITAEVQRVSSRI